MYYENLSPCYDMIENKIMGSQFISKFDVPKKPF